EGGDDVKSSRPLRPGLHTCYNGRDREQPLGDQERIYKPYHSSDRSLQLDSVKLESLVIAYHPCCGEYVPGPCTHRPSIHGSWGYLKSVTARSRLWIKLVHGLILYKVAITVVSAVTHTN